VSTNHNPMSRREYLKTGAYAVAAFLATHLFRGESAHARRVLGPKLSESDPVARSLGYVHEATQADSKRFRKRRRPDAAQQFCGSCRFYNQSELEGWGPCPMLQGKLVKETGWCKVWRAKAD